MLLGIYLIVYYLICINYFVVKLHMFEEFKEPVKGLKTNKQKYRFAIRHTYILMKYVVTWHEISIENEDQQPNVKHVTNSRETTAITARLAITLNPATKSPDRHIGGKDTLVRPHHKEVEKTH